jgi:hypothetical protein
LHRIARTSDNDRGQRSEQRDADHPDGYARASLA